MVGGRTRSDTESRRTDGAAAAYRRALDLAANDAEHRYLARRLSETAPNGRA
ncbi:hypothetical protein AB0C21_18110 [Spirillospora sp. NPDC049024]